MNGRGSDVVRPEDRPQRADDRPQRYIVRCGVMRTLCVLGAGTRNVPLSYGARVVARTPRGTEIGDVLCLATPQAVAMLDHPPEGQILRVVGPAEENELAHLREQAELELAICQRCITQLGLEMQLVDIEHLFGGERVVVYYLAESRVDFRELVRRLASELQTRVEMRQIGVRDEAKLLADYGDCGKPVCCNTHLTQMPPVSMKMAKLQKATLDPAKISGRCGRLKCCLRYEYDTYQQMRRELPAVGSQVVTEAGRATVLGQEILAQQLLVQTEDHRRILIAAADVLSVTAANPGSKHKSEGETRGGRRRPQGRNDADATPSEEE